MFTKEQVKAQWAEYRQAELDAGRPAPQASINLALLILSTSLFSQKDWGGRDYAPHPLYVAFNNTNSDIKIMIGILHDVIEDSDWTVEEFRQMGFHERVCRGVDAMTKRDDEKYFEFIERCGLTALHEDGKFDAIDKKIEDLKHNSDTSRTKGIANSEYANLKREAYNISLYYLIDLKKGKIEPGTRIIDYVRNDAVFSKTPDAVNRVLNQFSARPDRLGLTTSFVMGTSPA